MTIVREFSAIGPCLTLGKLINTTAQFYCYEEWKGGDRYEGKKRIRRDLRASGGRYSPAHVEACPSCRDHVNTQYPEGYMD